MRIHLHLESDSSPICSFLSRSVPAEDQEVIEEVTTGVFPNEVVTPTRYKVEKVVYRLSKVIGVNVPETHGTTLYEPYVDVFVSVIP